MDSLPDGEQDESVGGSLKGIRIEQKSKKGLQTWTTVLSLLGEGWYKTK